MARAAKRPAIRQDERRREDRIPTRLSVTVHVGGGGIQVLGTSVDLSPNGIFVEVPNPLELGQRVDLVIDAREKGSVVVTAGIVKHTTEKGAGIEFTHPSEQALERMVYLMELVGANA